MLPQPCPNTKSAIFSLLVIPEDRQRAGSTRSTRHDRPSHRNIAVDCARAAEGATLDIHDGATSRGEDAVNKGAAARLRVIGARGEEARN